MLTGGGGSNPGRTQSRSKSLKRSVGSGNFKEDGTGDRVNEEKSRWR
jgi:hypothetical protein